MADEWRAQIRKTQLALPSNRDHICSISNTKQSAITKVQQLTETIVDVLRELISAPSIISDSLIRISFFYFRDN